MVFHAGDKMVFVGDSITDCGRQRPVGEGSSAALGTGYVALVDAMLQTRHPGAKLRVVNAGIGGNTVRDLNHRWDTDVLDLRPDWVFVMIGINDVWRRFDRPQIPEARVEIDDYEATLAELVQATQPQVKGLFLLTPFFLESHREDAMRQVVDQYIVRVQHVGRERGVPVIDIQSAFDRILQDKYTAELAYDRVHPHLVGHLLIAQTIVATVDQ